MWLTDFVYRARLERPLHWMFLAFGTLILACGATHVAEMWTPWKPGSELSVTVRLVTAIAWLATAVIIPALLLKVRSALEEGRLSEERRRQLDVAHTELQERQRTLEQLIRGLPAAVLVVNRDGSPYFANELVKSILGADLMERSPAERAAAMFLAGTDQPYPPDRIPLRAALTGRTVVVDDLEVRREPHRMALEVTAAPVVDEAGRVVRAVAVFQDITGRKTLERELAHAQKMQAGGLLAGGVAHDFDNLLTALFGYTKWLEEGLPGSSALQEPVTQLRKTADRAAGLTRHLLAFSRKQALHVESLDLNQVLQDMEPRLRRLLPANVSLDWCFEADERVSADKTQLEQVVLNLVMNARDSMPEGGGLLVETASVHLDGGYLKAHVGSKTGRYVMLAVSDTGVGMDAATQARVFEPFFTTKGAGGAGLGLSTVYGIVKQIDGSLWLYSEPGRGTTMKIYLPATSQPPVSQSVETAKPLTGSERILLVEDDAPIRSLCAEALRRRGYTVDEATEGEHAIALAGRSDSRIDLLLTDVVLPGENGRRVAERVSQAQPGVKVLYMSGYTEHVIVHTGVLDSTMAFLPKPFTATALAERVRTVLDACPA